MHRELSLAARTAQVSEPGDVNGASVSGRGSGDRWNREPGDEERDVPAAARFGRYDE